MRKAPKLLPILLLIYGAASLIHFIHNAEFLRDYPGLPATWTRGGVYLVWIGMTAVGLLGWTLHKRGFVVWGLMVLAAYAAIGIDSLAHYIVAPMLEHSVAMNATILLEVTAATLVLVEVARLLARHLLRDRVAS
ncbi:hypothetical protein [Usitatibacter palustris]|uniref:Uncharacterized protein n=1 Tax=Usitatibacter palustris TaxID=2732487 RepID=A0A6M4H915_9PROT|nr:hypothetical protein [Usitatibacter palustris]QJR14874.1 hypothetical protein DSM104440_01689 [Usitatibacter palustris]